VVGKYIERKKEVESHFREKKSQMYEEFLGVLVNQFSGKSKTEKNEEIDLVPILRDWHKKIVVWGGADVVHKYIKWKLHLGSNEPDAESMFMMGDLFLAIRKDLGLSNKNISRKTFAHLMLTNSTLFLTLADQNPDITLAELGRIEKDRGLSDG